MPQNCSKKIVKNSKNRKIFQFSKKTAEIPAQNLAASPATAYIHFMSMPEPQTLAQFPAARRRPLP